MNDYLKTQFNLIYMNFWPRSPLEKLIKCILRVKNVFKIYNDRKIQWLNAKMTHNWKITKRFCATTPNRAPNTIFHLLPSPFLLFGPTPPLHCLLPPPPPHELEVMVIILFYLIAEVFLHNIYFPEKIVWFVGPL